MSRRVPRRAPLAAASLAAAAVLASAAPAPAVTPVGPGPSREVVATFRAGVRTIGDLRVGPLGSSRTVSRLSAVRAAWGRELRLNRSRCTASWGTGVRLLFTSFGGPTSCANSFLQIATVSGPRWVVNVGQQGYRIGLPRRQLPPGARFVRGWMGGGYELATMPFVGGRTTTVMAHVNRRTARVDRYVLFIGGAGD
jgi:hypothetical protein